MTPRLFADAKGRGEGATRGHGDRKLFTGPGHLASARESRRRPLADSNTLVLGKVLLGQLTPRLESKRDRWKGSMGMDAQGVRGIMSCGRPVMGWTRARLLAYKNEWYDDKIDCDGPVCYMLGTGGPRGGDIKWHYIGHTKNERRRMSCYGRDGSHLSDIIRKNLQAGWHLYYRSWAFDTKADAAAMEVRMLSRWKFDWNVVLNQG
jgi:hypothetical protein